MKKFRFFPLVLALCLAFGFLSPSALALEAPALSAQAVLLADLDSGRVLFERNAEQQRSPASLTKVMTVLLVLEAAERGEVSLEDRVVAGPDCRSGMRDDSSSVGIGAGEELSLRDLLYCAAVASGNDACNVLAVHTAGSIPLFVDRMNTRAAALGCESTRFVDPHGLSYDDLTSALDLYRITREAMRHSFFLELCDTAAYTVPPSNLHGARELKNSNALISREGIYGPDYYNEGAHGIKTGYTRAAGYCLISTAERDGLRLLAIVLGSDGPYLSDTTVRRNFTDSVKLYDWAFGAFERRLLLTAEEPVGTAQVIMGLGPAELLPAEDFLLVLPKDFDPAALELRITRFSPLLAPCRAGEELGSVQLLLDGEELGTVPLVAAADVPLRDLSPLLGELLDSVLLKISR